jgi:hypothetical protein
MGNQTNTGKAFEYALLLEIVEKLKDKTQVSIVENDPFETAKNCFLGFSDDAQGGYRLTSSAAINFLIDVEPRLYSDVGKDDILEIEIVSDARGQSGDVRDILTVRSKQKWEIGISAKNNHRAVKHSRLSPRIDFGDKWLGIPCSVEYFAEIKPVFDMLSEIRENDRTAKWDVIENMHETVYVPVLNAFRSELIRLDKENPNIVPLRLVEYLIGNEDFYKVIRGNNKVEIQAYNLHGTLNQAANDIKPKAKIPKVKLPNRLIEVVYQGDSSTTLIVSLNEGWQISFRIHSAKSTVEPSLKFDINLISAPHTLFTNHLFINEK